MNGDSGSIRFLIESYYDIQKLRIEAFNRIVAFVRSHSYIEDQSNYASPTYFENQRMYASHNEGEPHLSKASQNERETHFESASQSTSEIQPRCASQRKSEKQEGCAVKPSILAKNIIALKVQVPRDISELVWYHNSLFETEKNLRKKLDAWSRFHLLRTTYLANVKGIGPIFSSALIAWLSPISRFDNISKLWKYCGLAPGQKRRRGEKLGYNPHLKTLMWKIAGSFEKQKAEKSVFRALYEHQKKIYFERLDLKLAIEKREKGAKLHVRLMTMRYVEKRFLSDLWVVWRKLEGFPVTEPYAIAILHHTGKESPLIDCHGESDEA